MKIQCDVCQKEEASVFCSADEAALCDGCDRRVHHANKLASKHSRYSLLHPTFKESPLCDICQERKALLFCQEDRAILCRECDLPIHRSNEHTQKHNRFLLTGVKLSASSSSGFTSAINAAAALKTSSSSGQSQSSSVRKHSAISDHNQSHNCSNTENSGFAHPTFERSYGGGGDDEENNQMVSEVGSISASSISEYLMETLPGWRVDEFLLDPNNNNNNSSSNNGYCKTSNNMVRTSDYDFGTDTSYTSSGSSDFQAPWAPVSQYLPQENPLYPQSQAGIYFNHGQESTIAAPRNAGKSSRKRKDGGFYQPQFSYGIHSYML